MEYLTYVACGLIGYILYLAVNIRRHIEPLKRQAQGDMNRAVIAYFESRYVYVCLQIVVIFATSYLFAIGIMDYLFTEVGAYMGAVMAGYAGQKFWVDLLDKKK